MAALGSERKDIMNEILQKIQSSTLHNHIRIEDFGFIKSELFIRFEMDDKFYDLQIHNNGKWSIAEAK